MKILMVVARRLLLAAGLVLAVLALNFTLIHSAPGDPAQVIAGEMGGADEATMAKVQSLGAVAYLVKPLREMELLKVVGEREVARHPYAETAAASTLR